MDLLESGRPIRDRPVRTPPPTTRPSGALAVLVAALLVGLIGAGSLVLRDPAVEPVIPVARPGLPDRIVAVTDDDTRLLLGSPEVLRIVTERVRAARQLASGAIVAIARDDVVLLTRNGAQRFGLADAVYPAYRPDEFWVVAGFQLRRMTTGGALIAELRLPPPMIFRGETAEGLVVTIGPTVRIVDRITTRIIRTISENAEVLDVFAGALVTQRLDCPTCPLLWDPADGRPVALQLTSDPDRLRNRQSVRISRSGRHLAYTRLLASEPGNPLATVAEVVTVDTDSGQLTRVAESAGTDWATNLAWVGERLVFYRRLQAVVVVADPGREAVTVVPVSRTVDAVIGGF